MKCKTSHQNITITETGDWFTEHSREDGEWTHNNEPGNYSNRLDVTCHDCGYKAAHWKGQKAMPKWLRVAINELGI